MFSFDFTNYSYVHDEQLSSTPIFRNAICSVTFGFPFAHVDSFFPSTSMKLVHLMIGDEIVNSSEKICSVQAPIGDVGVHWLWSLYNKALINRNLFKFLEALTFHQNKMEHKTSYLCTTRYSIQHDSPKCKDRQIIYIDVPQYIIIIGCCSLVKKRASFRPATSCRQWKFWSTIQFPNP